MALMPGATQRPVTAHGGAMAEALGVVIHVTAGEGDPFNEFANPANQVSSHFGVGNGQGGMADGEIEQYVDTENRSWAQVAGNADYISVETEGEPTEPLTPAQVIAFARVLVWCHQTHGVPLAITDTPGERGLITHGDGGAAWGGHTGCPGDLRKAQRAAILAAAGTPNPPAPPTPGPAPAPVPSGGFMPPTLKPGSVSGAVRSLQTLLNMHNARLTVDGVFGPGTETGVKNYQHIMGLTVDGIAGPATWTALDTFG